MPTNLEGLISIITPVYNAEVYLEKCVSSIISQTYRELEIILINDGSVDCSGEICNRYASLDKRVVVIHQENAGMSAARNRGLEIAKGEYIGFVDSDDFIDPDMFQVLYDKAVETESDIVECNFHHTYRTGEDTEIVEKYYDKERLICLGRGIPWNKIYRHDLIQKTGARFPVGLYYAEDMEFYTKLIPFVDIYSYVDIAPYHYVQRAMSATNRSERTKHIFQVMNNITVYFKQNGIYTEYFDALEFLFARVLLCSSFLRICNISDTATRKAILHDNWNTLTKQYPEWRKNVILKGQKSKQALFMRSVNAFTYKVYSEIFPIICAANRRFSSKSKLY